VVGRVLGPVVGEEARCYPKGANNCGFSDLAGRLRMSNARVHYEMLAGGGQLLQEEEEGWRHHLCS
jgi:hypothetical protein